MEDETDCSVYQYYTSEEEDDGEEDVREEDVGEEDNGDKDK